MDKKKEMENFELKVLLLEDSFRDMELVCELLSAAGYILDLTHVEDEPGFVSALNKCNYDIILSDFKLPAFDAFGALEISEKICPEIPFICVSGSIGEETAIELLKLGAVDYVLKDRLERLPFAVKRALDEAKAKTAHLKSIHDLQESEIRFRQVAETAQEWIWEVDKNGLYTYTSPVIQSLLGYSPEEAVGKKYFYDSIVPEKKEELKNAALEVFSQKVTFRNFENPNIHKDGHVVILLTSGSPILDNDGNLLGYRGVDEDITERKHAERALKESEKKFRKLFQNHSAVKLIIDPDNGRIVDANNAAAEFYGWPVAELQNMKISDINFLLPEAFKNEMEKIGNQKNIHFEFKHRKKNDSFVDVEVFISRIKIGGKQFLHSIIHDISEKKKAEEKIKLLNRAIESSSVSVVITNREGTIEYVNPFSESVTGYSFNELIGNNPRVLKSGNQPGEFYEELWNTILSGKNWEGEFQNKKKNGGLYWEKAVISPIVNGDGNATNFVAIKEDITERKRILGELVAAKEKAEESDKLKTAFLNNISHEIRTPLNSILGFGQFLAEPEHSFDERIEYFNILQKSSNRLLNTVTDYMDMAMIVSGTMEVHKNEFHLQSYFKEIIEGKKQLCADKNIDFELHIPSEPIGLILNSDKEFIRKILIVFLDNALKFTKQGSISCGYRITSDFLEFFVQDTGKGIDVNKIEMIFDMFTQEDISNTRGYEGSGLGLAIAKGLVKLLGGSISAISEKGKGSTFTFTVPYAVPTINIKPSVEKKTSSTDISKLLVLIAEDEDSNYFYMEVIMKMIGCNYIHAINGAEAVEMCKQNKKINLVLMDIKMPVMNGLEATQLIHEFRPELPIIATTAYAQIGDEHRFLAAGCDGYLAKPVKKNNLLELLQKYI